MNNELDQARRRPLVTEYKNDELISKIEQISREISGQMDAHLIESIISLFHSGVLKHYVRSPRGTFNKDNCTMSIGAANGVKFEGREKLVELQKEIESLNGELGTAKECLMDALDYEEKSRKENEKLKAELSELQSGYKGACHTCEAVGEENVKLKAELESAKEMLTQAKDEMLACNKDSDANYYFDSCGWIISWMEENKDE